MKNLKTKVLSSVALVSAFASNAMAGVTMSNDGSVSGSLDMGTFYGVAAAVIVAYGAVFAVKVGLRLLK